MTCPHCGNENADSAAFCISCGKPADGATAMMDAPPLEEIDTVTLEAQPVVEDPLLLEVREALKNDYDVKRELGRGGMAVVYDGEERELHRRVALKILPPDMAASSTAERFKREARMAASLDHPNIIPVYRVGNAAGIHYMAMKFVEGRALDEIVKSQGALAIPIVVRILTDAARGLAYAHERKVIHRDIKGGNILIDTDGRVMVADFGIARALDDEKMTATGMVVGTPSYMSPEQCSGSEVVPQSDQYSLGILAFSLLTGDLPFKGESFIAVVQHHYLTPPPDIRAARKDVPESLLSVVYRALAKKPADRFPTTDDMVRALEAVPLTAAQKHEAEQKLRGLSRGERFSQIKTTKLRPPTPATPVPGAPTMVAQPPERKRSGLGIAAVLIVIVGGGGAAVAWQMGVFGPRAQPVVQSPATPPPQQQVLLGFTGTPAGAEILVNDERINGTSHPVAPNQIYRYVVTATGYETCRGNVQVGADLNHSVAIAETCLRPIRQSTPTQAPPARTQPVEQGKLFIRVDGFGSSSAVVRMDGQAIEANREVDVPVGVHRITVTAVGALPYDTTVTVSAALPTRLRVSLRQGN